MMSLLVSTSTLFGEREMYDRYLMLMYFSMTQIIIHGFIFNVKMKRFYNPGVGTMILILIPVGIYYI